MYGSQDDAAKSEDSTTASLVIRNESGTKSGPVTFAIATIQGADVLINLSVIYLLKDEFELSPAGLTLAQMAFKAPWALKPCLAILTDATRWGLLTRKTCICWASALSALSLVSLAFIGASGLSVACTLLVTHSLACAMCSAVGEGMVVESGRSRLTPGACARDICSFFAARRLTFAVMWYFSGLLLTFFSKQEMFLLSSVVPASVFVAALFHKEPAALPSERTLLDVLEHQYSRLTDVLKEPTVRGAASFIFAFMALPTCATPLFYFMTNTLHFSAEIIGRIQCVDCLASVGAIIAFSKFGSTVRVRTMMFYSTLILTPLTLLALVAVKRWNIKIGLPDVLFLATDQMAVEMIAEVQFMPVLILAAKLCPVGLESTLFAFLLAAGNVGLAVSGVLSAGLMAVSPVNFVDPDFCRYGVGFFRSAGTDLRHIHLQPLHIAVAFVDS